MADSNIAARLERVDVGEVFRTASGSLVAEEGFATQEMNVVGAPTTRNSTPRAVTDPINSSKSGASFIDLPPQVFDSGDTLSRRPRQPVAERRSTPLFLGQ
jgi:hypothetical protein